MNILDKLKQVARRGRAILQPIDNVPDHMARLTSRSAEELGIAPEVASFLAENARDTCRESGLIGSIYNKFNEY